MSNFSLTIRLATMFVGFNAVVIACLLSFERRPTPTGPSQAWQAQVGQSIAQATAVALTRKQPEDLRPVFSDELKRHHGLRSARLKPLNGEPVVVYREGADESASTLRPATLIAPLFADGEPWGELELEFDETTGDQSGLAAFWRQHATACFLVLYAVSAFPFTLFQVRRIIRRLNRTPVVPTRVKSFIDNVSLGVAVLDRELRIVHANQRFQSAIAEDGNGLGGRPLSQFPVKMTAGKGEPTEETPWQVAFDQKIPVQGKIVTVDKGAPQRQAYLAHATPVLSKSEECTGVLVTLDDVTPLERRNRELQDSIKTLTESQASIQRQNEELRHLATRDSLTGLLNRRAFLEVFESQFHMVRRYGGHLSCILLDIDYFKQINDRYGHAAGDEVLKQVAGRILNGIRAADVVCRYGGEEFCLLLPWQDIDGAMAAAERIRKMVLTQAVRGLPVTASLGVTSHSFGAADVQAMIQQADEALYEAKGRGRNRSMAWNQTPGLAALSCCH